MTVQTSHSFTCWCDGEPSCGNDADTEYGLCDDCRRQGHRSLPPLPFSCVEPEQSVTTDGSPYALSSDDAGTVGP